jgi:hypothetical protein
MRAAAAAMLLTLLLVPAHAQELEPRFRPVDVYVDTGSNPLAAYQVEVVATNATIAGIEGGEHQAFGEPPYYDAKALHGGRIILAGFDTGAEVPRGRTRVATLHMREDGAASYAVRLMAAGNSSGQRISAEAFVEPRE